MRTLTALGLWLVVFGVSSLGRQDPTAAPTPTHVPEGGAAQAAVPSVQDVNDRFVREWSTRIAGKEHQPASEVFKNVQIDWLKAAPAEDFIGIMDGGYAKALGVRCTHCHDPDDFASDEKRPKRAAREMARMHWDINQQLRRMKNLESSLDDRPINCATCHRGEIDPHLKRN